MYIYSGLDTTVGTVTKLRALEKLGWFPPKLIATAVF